MLTIGTWGSKALRATAGVVAFLLVCAASAQAAVEDVGSLRGAALQAKYASLKEKLGNNQFSRPLHMESSEGASSVAGEVFAVVAHPFATVGSALGTPAQWCDMLILHLNTKYCRPASDGGRTVLQVGIGKKFDQPVDQAYRVDFNYRVAATSTDYLRVNLDAGEGPLGTSDYHITLEAVPADAGQTFLRLSYAYSYGFIGRMAMATYLGTVGRNKVGFTLIDTAGGTAPRYIGGMRGVVERNTMRYFLAIEAYLGVQSLPPQARMEKSFRDWFAAVERYPRQLHEMEQGEYREMKRREYSRQQVG